jgi:hypothetical protein
VKFRKMKLHHLLLCLSLGLIVLVTAQTTVQVTKTVQVTQVSTVYGSPLATNAPAGADSDSSYNGDSDQPQDPNEEGASGKESGAFTISKGGMVAIIVVASVVGVFGGA